MQAGRIDAVKNASNYDNNSDQNQRVMRPQRGPEQLTVIRPLRKKGPSANRETSSTE